MNIKKGLEYFSLDVNFFTDEKIEIVCAEFGCKSEILIIKLLCKIYQNGYFINWDEDVALLFAKRLGEGFDKEFVNAVVDKLVFRNFFDKANFEKYNILTSKGIQLRYFEATKRRNSVAYDERFMLVDCKNYSHLEEKECEIYEVSKQENENAYTLSDNVYILKQSKVKESKVKESKVKEIKAVAASKSENLKDETSNIFENQAYEKVITLENKKPLLLINDNDFDKKTNQSDEAKNCNDFEIDTEIETENNMGALNKKLNFTDDEIITYFVNETGINLSNKTREIVLNWEKTLSFDVLKKVVEEAVCYNSVSFRYMAKIVENWANNGVDNLEKLCAFREQFFRKKAGNSIKSKAINKFANFNQREHNFDELYLLERKLIENELLLN